VDCGDQALHLQNVRKRSKGEYSLRADVFRFAPESGLKSDIAGGPVRATSGLMRCNKVTIAKRAGAHSLDLIPMRRVITALRTRSDIRSSSGTSRNGSFPYFPTGIETPLGIPVASSRNRAA
jgi:hypothetical protein